MSRKFNYISLFFLLMLVFKFSFYSNSSTLLHDPHIDKQIDNSSLILTDEEKEWIKDHPVIKVGSDPNWAPFEFRDNDGKYQGINIQYLKIIEKKIGVHFIFDTSNIWQEIMDKAFIKEIDLITGINETSLRNKYFNFSDIYISHPISIFAHKDITHIRDLNELSGEKVAVVKYYYTNEILKENYPEINLVIVETPQEALKLLNKKKVTAYIEGMVTGSYYIADNNYTNIHIVGDTPYNYNLRMAVRKDWEILPSILNKALNNISKTEKDNIYYSWISIKTKKKFNYLLFFEFIIPLAILLTLFVFWNRKLRKEVLTRKETQNDLNKVIEELKDTQTQLVQSEKMSTVGILTAGIAHEIKNPLNYIMMGIDGIKNGVKAYEKIIAAYENIHNELSEESIKNIQELKKELDYNYYRYECESLTQSVQDGIENIHEITNSLNTFSYFAGKEMVFADINEGIKSTLVILRSQYKYKIEIIEKLEANTKIKCFPGKLNQVFVNLISNAIQAIEDKGTITIRTSIENNFIKISIKDTGKGISPEEKSKVFSPFYTTKEIGKGTGLGLAISKNIIDEHNGTIEVNSKIGLGTEFIISLPLV